jgi:hypothetical protein
MDGHYNGCVALASDELHVLHTVVSRLEAGGFPYMLSGSAALAVYSTPRMTRDLDIVVQLESDDVEPFVRLFAGDFYCDGDAVRRSVVSRSMVNLIELERVVKVDIIVRKDTPYRRTEFERRRLTAIDGQQVWVVSAEDLLLSKLEWAKDGQSSVQLRDVRELVASSPNLDWPYIERWARELSVASLLVEIRP